MQFELRNSAMKVGAGAVLLVMAGAYLTFSTRQLLAAHYADDQDSFNLRRAVALDANDAAHANRLGRYQLVSEQSPRDAEQWLLTATKLNPHAANYWMDLAVAQQSQGDASGEENSLARALAADPHNPEIAWDAANLFLAEGSKDQAQRLFHVVLENDPPLVLEALNICWKSDPDVDHLLDKVVPGNVYLPFLEFLISRGETQGAALVWQHIFSAQQKIDRTFVLDYLKYLILNREVAQASLAWDQAGSLADLEAYQPSSENLLINGDFSLEILNGGFDWVHRDIRGVSLALDTNEPHSSSRSLRITLDGPGIQDAGIVQVVPVEPSTSYEFSGFYKAKDMDGAGAMEFAINDAYKNTTIFTSEDLRDADFWKKTGGIFVTGPDTHLIALRIARVPSGSPIRGKLWIDGLQLVRRDAVSIASAAQEAR